MIEVRFEGIKELSTALDRWEGDVIQRLTQEVDKSGEHLLSVSKQLCPVLTGDLMRSGTKDPVKVDAMNREISSSIGFHKRYAARRHEEVYSPGPITRGKPVVDGMVPGRKYIEQPLMRYPQRYMRQWADAIASMGLR